MFRKEARSNNYKRWSGNATSDFVEILKAAFTNVLLQGRECMVRRRILIESEEDKDKQVHWDSDLKNKYMQIDTDNLVNVF